MTLMTDITVLAITRQSAEHPTLITINTARAGWQAECLELARSGEPFAVEKVTWEHRPFFNTLSIEHDLELVWGKFGGEVSLYPRLK